MTQRFPGKPPLGASINWENPITRGLVFCAPFVEGMGQAFDLVRPRSTSTTLPQWTSGKSGLAARLWKFPQATSTDLDWTTGPFSVYTYFALKNLSVSFPDIFGRYNYASEGSNQGWQLSINTTGGLLSYRGAVYRNNGLANYGLLASRVVTLGDHTLLMTSDATTRRLYVDGQLDGTTTNNPTPVSQTTNGPFGDTGSGSGNNPNYICCCWNRELTLQEAQELRDDPFCVLRFEVLRSAYLLPVSLGFQCDGIGGLAWVFTSPGFQCDGIGSLDWLQVDAGNAWQMDGVGGLEWTTNYWTMDGGSACTWDVPAAVTLGAFRCDGIGGLEWRTQAGVPVNCATPDDTPVGAGVSAVVNKMF